MRVPKGDKHPVGSLSWALTFFSEEATAGRQAREEEGGPERMAWLLQRGPGCHAFVTWQTESDAV